MGTRSSIAVKHVDGTITGIYCHWDGYPSHNGAILNDHYQDPAKIQQLLALGDLSSLAPAIGEAHDFDDRIEGVCTFYGRDRGELGCEAKTFANMQEWMEHYSWSDYYYLWNGKEWLIADSRGEVWDLLDVILDHA